MHEEDENAHGESTPDGSGVDATASDASGHVVRSDDESSSAQSEREHELGSSDDDFEDTATDHQPPRQRPRSSSSVGMVLVGLGATVWAAVAVIRCTGAPPPGPSLAMEETLPPEPAATPPQAPKAIPHSDGPPAPRSPKPHDEVSAPSKPPQTATADWAKDPPAPTKVGYTIRRGGSIKNVANLFKIYHHEIQDLNPGVGLERELPPDTTVTVYKRTGDDRSESVGYPSDGSLEGGVPMLDGPGRQLKAIPWKAWGTASTVALLDQVLRRWSKRGSDVQPVLVGNISARNGGRLQPHSTHQSGRDVDLSYLQKLGRNEELNWRSMTEANLDAGETWALLQLLQSTGAVEVMYIDRSIQKLLYDHASRSGLLTRSELRRWMEYPRPTGSGRPLIQHVKGHIDHIHVRFACTADEKRCKSRNR